MTLQQTETYNTFNSIPINSQTRTDDRSEAELKKPDRQTNKNIRRKQMSEDFDKDENKETVEDDGKVSKQEIIEIKKMDRASQFKKAKMIGGIVSAVLGALLLFWPGLTMGIICQAVGAALGIIGVLTAATFFSQPKDAPFRSASLVAGIPLALIGLFIFLRPAFLIEFIPIVVGVIVLLDGIGNLFETMSIMKQGNSKWWVSLIFAILTILGGLVLIMRPFSIARILMRVIGAITLYNGLSDIFIASRIKDPIRDI